MIRSFVAIDLPSHVQEALEKFQRALQKVQATVSWIRADRIHLTLKFLGDVAPERLADIETALTPAAASSSCFRLQAAGCGAFPSLKQMRVVWAGVRGDLELLRDLQAKVDAALVSLGFEPENRPFRAHLTLGRVKGRQHLRLLQEALLANRDFEAEAFDVAELVLYKSELRPEGARYTPLFRVPFAGCPD